MKTYLRAATLLACTFTPALASAQLITFETTPAGVIPTDDAALITPYNLTGGGNVMFYFDVNTDNNLNPGDLPGRFERIGADGNDGFTNSIFLTSDVATPPHVAQLGTWFLRRDQPSGVPKPFLIDYNTLQTITGLSGEIWDIDGAPGLTEQWNVDVLDAAGTPLVPTLASPLGNNQLLDGKPWTFTFSGLPLGVDKVRLTFTGSKPDGIGLAFNNFSPFFPIPEPSSVLLAAMAFGAMSLRRLSRRS
jgi:hypothetical protein